MQYCALSGLFQLFKEKYVLSIIPCFHYANTCSSRVLIQSNSEASVNIGTVPC